LDFELAVLIGEADSRGGSDAISRADGGCVERALVTRDDTNACGGDVAIGVRSLTAD
jgi:hypothetical protein